MLGRMDTTTPENPVFEESVSRNRKNYAVFLGFCSPSSLGILDRHIFGGGGGSQKLMIGVVGAPQEPEVVPCGWSSDRPR